jgi:hypothetical protein
MASLKIGKKVEYNKKSQHHNDKRTKKINSAECDIMYFYERKPK